MLKTIYYLNRHSLLAVPHSPAIPALLPSSWTASICGGTDIEELEIGMCVGLIVRLY